jgi:hypothetical protein
MVASDLGLEQFLAAGPETLESALLVLLHKSGIANDIGGKNSCELPVHDHPPRLDAAPGGQSY